MIPNRCLENGVGHTGAEVRRWLRVGWWEEHRGYVVSGDLWQRFTAELQRLTAEVPGLADVAAGPDDGDAAGRYRSMCAVLSEIACTASELDDGRVWTWLASDAVAAVRTAAATAALEADGLAVDAAMDPDAHLRRA